MEIKEPKDFICGLATLTVVAWGAWSLFGGKRYESMAQVPMADLVAELGRRLK
jgi:hypothetical protein